MADIELEAGMKAEREVKVEKKHLASGSGIPGADVLSTPSMIEVMELACYDAVQGALPPGYVTVGTFVNVRHLKMTPAGDNVRAEAVLEKADGAKLLFSVKASDSEGEIGRGEHGRFAVNAEKFFAPLK